MDRTERAQRQVTWTDQLLATGSWIVRGIQDRAAQGLYGLGRAIEGAQAVPTAEHFDRVVRYSLAALNATYQATIADNSKGSEANTDYYLHNRDEYLASAKTHWGEVWARAKNGFDVDFAAKALIAAGTIAVAPRTLILSTALTLGFFRFTTTTKEMIFEGVDQQNENAGNLPLYAGALYSALLLSWKVAEGTPSSFLSVPLSIATGVALGFSISRPEHMRDRRQVSTPTSGFGAGHHDDRFGDGRYGIGSNQPFSYSYETDRADQ